VLSYDFPLLGGAKCQVVPMDGAGLQLVLCWRIIGEQGQRWGRRSAGNQQTEQQASLMKMPGMADK